MSQGAKRLEELRRQRSRPAPQWGIAPVVQAIQTQAGRHDRKLGELSDLWIELVPRELAAQSRLASIRGGVLAVIASSAAVSYELDRLLRGGLEGQLRARHRGTLVRIRLGVGAIDDVEPPRRRSEQKTKRNRG